MSKQIEKIKELIHLFLSFLKKEDESDEDNELEEL